MLKESDEDSGNPLKRKSTDGGVDYPRRRATIAVCDTLQTKKPFLKSGTLPANPWQTV